MKKCSKCGTVKPESEFYKRGDSDRLRSHCKSCYSDRAAIYFQGHKDEFLERGKRWRDNNPDRAAEIIDKYQESHKEEIKQAARLRYWNNRESELRRTQIDRDNNREKWRAYWRAWNRSHREHCRSTHKNYMARKHGADGNCSSAEWDNICARYENKCLCCGEVMPLTRDHIVPLSRGGSNNAINIQPLCLSCNSKKRGKIIDFRPDAYWRDWT